MQYLNLSGLDRKLETEDERNQVKFIWEYCLPIEFLRFTLEEENYKSLGALNTNYQKCTEILFKYLQQNESHLQGLINAVQNNLVVLTLCLENVISKNI